MKDNEKIVKEYDVRIIASIMENAMLCDNIEQIFEFAQDIIDKEVDVLNFKKLQKEIIFEINKQYPNIQRYTNFPTAEYDECYVATLVDFYRKNFGDNLDFEVYARKKKIFKPFHFKYKK